MPKAMLTNIAMMKQKRIMLNHEHGDADEHSHGEGDEHDHNAGEDSHGGHEEVKISDAAIQKLNIEVEEVSSALVRETIAVTGRITLNQNTSAQVKARFSGVIRSVLKEPGETSQKPVAR